MKPLAIDLSKAKLFDAANAAVKELVAGWTQNPNHVPLRIGHQSPRSIALVLRLMSHFKNAGFSARLASRRQVRASSPEPCQHCVAVRTARVVCFLLVWISSVKHAAKIARRLPGAFLRAIASIGGGWDYLEMGTAAAAIRSVLRNVRLFTTSAPSNALRALVRAIKFVWPDSREAFVTVFAGQIIHA